MSSKFDLELYKIHDLADSMYDDLYANNFDFTKHLKPLMALNKKVEKRPDGRPIYTRHYLGDELYAKVTFMFIVNPTNSLVTERCVVLNYALKEAGPNEEILFGPDIVIKHKIYDMKNTSDIQEVVHELESARIAVLSEIKGFCLGVISALQPEKSVGEIKVEVAPFWDETDLQRQHFIELGTPDFKAAIAMGSPEAHPWLGLMFTAEGHTLQQYMLSVLTYDSTSSFPEDNDSAEHLFT